MKRNKGYTFLNVAGLAIGIAACLIISFYIRNELSYDDYHTESDRIYRIAVDIQSSRTNRIFATTCGPLAPALKKDFPQVDAAVRLWRQNNKLIKYGKKNAFYEDNFFLVDPSIFDVFTIPLSKGTMETALNRPNTLLIAEETAKKYFGAEDPIGKTVLVNDEPFEVTGVMKHLADNSHMKFNLITSLATVEKESWFNEDIQNWHSTMYYTYIKVTPNTNISDFAKEIETAANRYVGDVIKGWGTTYRYFLQPIKSIHLHSDLSNEAEVPGNAANVYIFIVVAVLIILIAALNYINLTTAQSSNRAKEIGVRKAVGAAKSSIFNQFLGESILLTLFALISALLLVMAIKPLFEHLSGQVYHLGQIFTFQFTGVLLGLTLLVGILAAIYPALFLSSFRPVTVLKGKIDMGNKGTLLRQILVVSQFTISIILIVGTLIVYKQLNYMKDQRLGFDKEQTLILPIKGGVSIADRLEQLKDEFGGHSSVVSVAASSSIPGKAVANYSASLLGEADDKSQSMYYLFVDADFLNTYGIEMIAGRPFDKRMQTDAETTFLINEKAVSAFGWASPEEAIGKRLSTGFQAMGQIIGVYKNFNYRSLQAPIEPLIMAVVPWRFNYISLKLNTANLSSTTAFVEKKWHKLFPQSPYEYFFLDEEFNRQYTTDEKMGRTFLVFTGIAIFISCLGLFGLATFVAKQRTKEIGIRKVLGASVTGIVELLSKDFIKLVLLALVIASPLAWWAIHQWLQGFAYRINIEWWVFLVAGLVAVLIAQLTVSIQAIRAAVANPVDSLRDE